MGPMCEAMQGDANMSAGHDANSRRVTDGAVAVTQIPLQFPRNDANDAGDGTSRTGRTGARPRYTTITRIWPNWGRIPLDVFPKTRLMYGCANEHATSNARRTKMTTNPKRKGTRKANAYELGDDLVITKTIAPGLPPAEPGCTGRSPDTASTPLFSRNMPNAPTTSWATAASRSSGLPGSRTKRRSSTGTAEWTRPAASAKTQAVVDFLADGLAEHIYHN